MSDNLQSFLKFISLYELDYWDVKRYDQDTLKFKDSVLLKSILEPYKEPISKEIIKKNKWQIIAKINFSGELFLREHEEIESYKGKLYKVPQNSIIYSKINVRHGCIYFHSENDIPFAVSSEYPIFIFDKKKVNGSYLKLVLRSESFKKLLDTKTSGIGKSRVKVDEFLSIKIPLPSLTKQNELVTQYSNKILLSVEQVNEANTIEKSIEQFFNEQIGLKIIDSRESKQKSFLKIVHFLDIEKWGVDKVSTQNNIEYTKNYIRKPIKDLCKVGSGGTPSRNKKEYYTGDIPWIKTGEVVNDIIYDTEEKITEEAIANSSAKLYPKDSLIIAMYGQGLTRGRTAKLGINASTNQACAVLHDIDNNMIDIDYLWFYMMNEYHRLRELASGNNQPNLNAEMIKNYKVVIPDFDTQKKIVQEISNRKEQIRKLKNAAQKNRELAIEEFEREIFNEA